MVCERWTRSVGFLGAFYCLASHGDQPAALQAPVQGVPQGSHSSARASFNLCLLHDVWLTARSSYRMQGIAARAGRESGGQRAGFHAGEAPLITDTRSSESELEGPLERTTSASWGIDASESLSDASVSGTPPSAENSQASAAWTGFQALAARLARLELVVEEAPELGQRQAEKKWKVQRGLLLQQLQVMGPAGIRRLSRRWGADEGMRG